MINQLKFFLCSAAAAIGLFAISPSARATPTLYVNGTAVALASDLGSGQWMAIYTSSNVPGWSVLLTCGAASGTTSPDMMLYFAVTSAGAGSLTLSFSGDSFGPTNKLMVGSFSSTVNPADPLSTVTFSTLVNDTNTLNTGTPLFANQVLASGASDSSASTLLSLPAFYSLTQIVTIVHYAAGTSSGAYTLAAVPEAGSTLGLMVLALGGLAALRRRRS